MPFAKGDPKPPGSGRKKGVGKKQVIVISASLCKDPRVRLEELGCDPLAVLADLATDPGVENGVRRLAAADLAAFVWPRKKAIEVIGSVDVHHSIGTARQTLADRVAGIRERVAPAGIPQLTD